MPTKKTTPAKNDKAAPVAEEIPREEEMGEDVELTATVQSADQKMLLERVARFLVNIQAVGFSARAARNGYDAAAHAEGWRLYNKAAGADRPLEHWFGEQAQAEDATGITGDRLRLLTDLDTFENLWFPRVKAIIRRMVPRDTREAFAAAFFANLTQQPLGPGVVGSVAALLQRIEGLEKSKEPGAKEVLATLRRRGLTTAKIAEVRTLLKHAEEGSPRAPRKGPVTAVELAEAQAKQEEAFEDLRDWFNDWATHLRSVFNLRHQIVLGLAVRSGKSAPQEPANGGKAEARAADGASAEKPGEAGGKAAKQAPSAGSDQ